jgi:2-polyprenyl-3-methyl-5-hydroxy-6-metoxy-1,4-benzoquinol methylase
MVFGNPDSPVYMLGSFEVCQAVMVDQPKVSKAFRNGGAAGYHDRCNCLFSGMSRFFAVSYKAHLVQEWLPALDGVVEKLRRGVRVADIGCGHGASTILMAEAFERSMFWGIDNHEDSIACARDAAERDGMAARTRFDVATAKNFTGGDFDLICCFDALHDLGDPVGAARRILQALTPDGTFMAVEPRAGDRLEDNINPVGRLYYAGSTMICTPVSMAQEVGLALGGQAGPKRLEAVLRAAETPFTIVLEARRRVQAALLPFESRAANARLWQGNLFHDADITSKTRQTRAWPGRLDPRLLGRLFDRGGSAHHPSSTREAPAGCMPPGRSPLQLRVMLRRGRRF